MPHPEDNAGILMSVDDIREYEFKRGADSRQAEVDSLKEKAMAAIKELADHMRTHEPALTTNQKLIGIQVFTDRGYYKDYERVVQHVKQVGFKQARSFLGPDTKPAHLDQLNRLSEECGVTWTLTLGRPREVLSEGQKSEVEGKVASLKKVERVCGWNEPNYIRGQGPAPESWIGDTVDHCDWIYDTFGSRHRVGSFQLWAGQLKIHHADLNRIGPLAHGTFNDICWHLYKPGEDKLLDFEKRYRDHFGDLPIVCTETGMSTAVNQRQNAEWRTPEDQAPYLVQHLSLYTKRGYEVFLFELEDGPNDLTHREDGLGIFFKDGRPKPAVAAIRDLLKM